MFTIPPAFFPTMFVARTAPAEFGLILSVLMILPLKILVAPWVPEGAYLDGSSLIVGMSELFLLSASGALIGHASQFLCEDVKLRPWRIFTAVLACNVLMVAVFSYLTGGT